MKKKNWIFLFVLTLFFSWGCEDPLEKYQDPEWLDGNMWETLEKMENYSVFLEGVEKAGFKEALSGKGLVTVLAPDDEAFKRYFQKTGYSSLNDMPEEELKLTILMHVLKYHYKSSEEMLRFVSAGAAASSAAGFDKGWKHAHVTWARSEVKQELDEDTDEDLWVFSGYKRLFFYSNLYFADACNLSDPAYNFEKMFPGYSLESNAIYAANAKIINDVGIPTEQGYLFKTNDVIESQPSLDEKISTDQLYSKYNELVKPFVNYIYSEAYSETYSGNISGVDSLFIKEHHNIYFPVIAKEDTYEYYLTSNKLNTQPSLVTTEGTTLFVPDNPTLEDYFNQNILPSYPDGDLPLLSLKYLIRGTYNNGFIKPEQIKNGTAETFDGDILQIDIETDVNEIQHCSNGLFYGVKKMQEPSIFSSVAGPLLLDSTLTDFMFLLEKTNYVIPLAQEDFDFTLFVPENRAVRESGFYPDYYELKSGEINVYDGTGGDAELIEDDLLLDVFSKSHIVLGLFDIGSTPVYLNTMTNYFAIKVDENGIDNGDNEPSEMPLFLKDYGSLSNGRTYKIDQGISAGSNDVKSVLEKPEFSEFYSLLVAAGLDDYEFFIGEHVNVFAPSNAAIVAANGAGLIPADPDELKEFLKYFFVPLESNNLGDYYLPAYSYDNEMVYTSAINLETSTKYETFYQPMYIFGDGTQLIIKNRDKSQSAQVNSEDIYITIDGVVATIDEVICI